jgi:hypothetical protein
MTNWCRAAKSPAGVLDQVFTGSNSAARKNEKRLSSQADLAVQPPLQKYFRFH